MNMQLNCVGYQSALTLLSTRAMHLLFTAKPKDFMTSHKKVKFKRSEKKNNNKIESK